jgi:hypothetical protein
MHPDIMLLYKFKGSKEEFLNLVKAMKAKYADDPVMLMYIERAEKMARPQNARNRVWKNSSITMNAPLCLEAMKKEGNPFIRPCWRDIIPLVMKKLQNAVSGKWLCGKTSGLMAHQIVHYEAAKMIALNPDTSAKRRRGLLVVSNTGSGKTTTSLSIMIAFWDKRLPNGKRIPILFVTDKDNAKNNTGATYAENLLIFFPKESREIFAKADFLPPQALWNQRSIDDMVTFKTPNNTDMTVGGWCQKIGAPILGGRVTGLIYKGYNKTTRTTEDKNKLSYTVFAKPKEKSKLLLDKMKTGAVCIVDEAHGLYKPKDKDERIALANMRQKLTLPSYMINSYLFLLTATPGDTASQIMGLINFVRPAADDPITVHKFVRDTQIIRGLVSYADIRGDKSVYGTLTKTINQNVPMKPWYWVAYVQNADYMKLANKGKTGNKVYNLNINPGETDKFFRQEIRNGCYLPHGQTTKMLNNVLTKSEKAELQAMTVPGKGGNNVILSEKMKTVVDNAMNIPGCQYIYVKKDADKGDNIQVALVNYMRKRGYEIAKSVANLKSKKLRVWSVPNGKESGEDDFKSPLKDFFNSNTNKTGEYISVAVGSRFHGLNLKHLRAVHIVTPLASVSDDIQMVGRALRLCGHKEFVLRNEIGSNGERIKEDTRSVVLYRYYSTPPRSMAGIYDRLRSKKRKDFLQTFEKHLEHLVRLHEQGINKHVYTDALRRGAPLTKFLNCVYGQSIECEINTKRGGLLFALQNKPVKCGKNTCNVRIDNNGELMVSNHQPGDIELLNQVRLINRNLPSMGSNNLPQRPGQTRSQSRNSGRTTQSNRSSRSRGSGNSGIRGR